MIRKIRHVWSRGLVGATLQRALSRLGITVMPFHLYRESLQQLHDSGNRFHPHTPGDVIFPGPHDPGIVGLMEQNAALLKEFDLRWRQGASCIVMIRHRSVVAYGWYHLSCCCYPYFPFALAPDEAYLFNFFTDRKARGRDYAPYLRILLCLHLADLGRGIFISVTERVNTPAIRFKKKINARIVSTLLHIDLFGVFKKTFRLSGLDVSKERRPL